VAFFEMIGGPIDGAKLDIPDGCERWHIPRSEVPIFEESDCSVTTLRVTHVYLRFNNFKFKYTGVK